MSNSAAFATEWLVDARSIEVRPGQRRAAKKALTKVARRRGDVQMLKDLCDHAQAVAQAAAEYAESQQADAQDEDYIYDLTPQYGPQDDASFEALNQHIDEDFENEVPLALQGALPDWMLDQITDQGRSAFDDLSLFEAPSRARKAHLFDD